MAIPDIPSGTEETKWNWLEQIRKHYAENLIYEDKFNLQLSS